MGIRRGEHKHYSDTHGRTALAVPNFTLPLSNFVFTGGVRGFSRHAQSKMFHSFPGLTFSHTLSIDWNFLSRFYIIMFLASVWLVRMVDRLLGLMFFFPLFFLLGYDYDELWRHTMSSKYFCVEPI